MPRGVLGKRGRGEVRGLVGQPATAVDHLRALVRPAPRHDLLPDEQGADGGDGPHRIEGDLVVPRRDACVEDGVGEGEEHLHVFVDAMAVAA